LLKLKLTLLILMEVLMMMTTTTGAKGFIGEECSYWSTEGTAS
jgi:hypothetical protein